MAAYPNIADNWPGICEAATAWGIDHPLVLIGMIGTIAKESGSFYPVREAWWIYDEDPAAAMRYYADTRKHAAYNGGPQYHGRGYVQTTHIGGYQLVQNQLASIGVSVDLVGNPDLLLQPLYAAHALAIYFKFHGYPPEGMVAACMAQNYQEVRKAVYGAYDADGEQKIRRAESVLLPLAQNRGLV